MQRSAQARLWKALKDPQGIVAVISDPACARETVSEILGHLTSTLSIAGIFVMLNGPYGSLSSSRGGVNGSRLYLIDAASRKSGPDKSGKAYFVDSPGSLTDLSLAINVALVSGKFKFLVFDSVSTLASFCKENIAGQFMHYLISRMRNAGILGVIICTSKVEPSGAISQVIQFCDRVVNV